MIDLCLFAKQIAIGMVRNYFRSVHITLKKLLLFRQNLQFVSHYSDLRIKTLCPVEERVSLGKTRDRVRVPPSASPRTIPKTGRE